MRYELIIIIIIIIIKIVCLNGLEYVCLNMFK